MPRRGLAHACLLASALLAASACRDRERREAPASEEDRKTIAEAQAKAKVDTRKFDCVEELTDRADLRFHPLLRSLCAEWVNQDIPGVALAVVEGDELVLHAERGLRCFGEDEPVLETTPFRLGSIAKPVTAAVALAMREAGVVDLQVPVDHYVDEFAGQGERAPPSVEALLRHQSGLGEIVPDDLVALEGDWLAALNKAAPLPAGPGEFAYSNSGYSLAGHALERAGERDYATLVHDYVAAPLDAGSITASVEAAAKRGAACGHLSEDRDRHPITVLEDLDFMPGDPSWMNPSGGVLGSASDLARFAAAIGGERLPGSAAMLEEGAPVPAGQEGTQPRADLRYGLGLRSWELSDGTRAYGHSGKTGLFTAELVFVPGKRAIVVLANVGVDLASTRAAAEALLSED